ncbi:MAG TPA: sugar transferase [Aldersonia sp.]
MMSRRSGLVPRAAWQARYERRLLTTDVACVVGAIAVAQYVRFGADQFLNTGPVDYTVFSVLFAALWLAMLSIFRTRSPRVIGEGAEEYRRIVVASLGTFGLIAMVALLAKVDLARGYLAVALPIGLGALLASRALWRAHVLRVRREGGYQTAVLVVGDHRGVETLARSFVDSPRTGYAVVGACVPRFAHLGHRSIEIGDHAIPVLGDTDAVLDAVAASGADTVAVTATEHLGVRGMRKLSWDLERLDVDLVVSPGVIDVAGPRLSMRPVAGLPLVHVEKPQYHGAQRFQKRAFDVVFAGAALTLLAPLLLAVAIAVKATSRGPVLYRAERIGLDGKPFQMLKFRSMVVDADKMADSLLARNESRGGVLFKIRDDPRVTRIGKILRRTSVDELPQFVNVLRKEMSVVGPRPPLRREVATYDGEVHRRLLVRPGITGLWQVSGRSNLSWEESVRLDLSYVENWSLVGDIVIVLKTIRAVAGSDGAY